jgi:transposase
MADRITYVGLEVHEESIDVAAAAGGLRGEVREFGRIEKTPAALDRSLRKLAGDDMTLRFCYERGLAGMPSMSLVGPGGTSASWSPSR